MSDDEEELRTCSNCKREIPLASFLMHEAHCRRHMDVCRKCNEPIPRSKAEEHHEEFHVKVSCPLKCGKRMERRFVDEHNKKKCVERKEICQFCNLQMTFKELGEHENYCGSRTEQCEECGRYVMLKEKLVHQCGGVSTKNCRFCDLPVPADQLAGHEDGCGTRTEPCDKCAQSVMLKEKEIHASTNCRGLLSGTRQIVLDAEIVPRRARERRRQNGRAPVIDLKSDVSDRREKSPAASLPWDYLQPSSVAASTQGEGALASGGSSKSLSDDDLPWLIESDVAASAGVNRAVGKAQGGGAMLAEGLDISKSFVAPPGMNAKELLEEHLRCEQELEKRKKTADTRRMHSRRTGTGHGEAIAELVQMKEDHRMAETLQKEGILSTKDLEVLGVDRKEQELEFLRLEELKRVRKGVESMAVEGGGFLEKQHQLEDDHALAQQLQEEMEKEIESRPGGSYAMNSDSDGSGEYAGRVSQRFRNGTYDDKKTCRNCSQSFFEWEFIDHQTSCRRKEWDRRMCSHCFKFFLAEELIDHQVTCPKRRVKRVFCEYCYEEILESRLSSHEVTCPEKPKRSLQNCQFCFQGFPKYDLKSHERTCSKRRIKSRCPDCNTFVINAVVHAFSCKKLQPPKTPLSDFRDFKKESKAIFALSSGSEDGSASVDETLIPCETCLKSIPFTEYQSHQAKCVDIHFLAQHLDRDMRSSDTAPTSLRRSASFSGSRNRKMESLSSSGKAFPKPRREDPEFYISGHNGFGLDSKQSKPSRRMDALTSGSGIGLSATHATPHIRGSSGGSSSQKSDLARKAQLGQPSLNRHPSTLKSPFRLENSQLSSAQGSKYGHSTRSVFRSHSSSSSESGKLKTNPWK
eukprot:m.17335 g.17335  ORF g.17335 m.17335 type:complete len:860 (+) comp27451_c0_seq1:139-2718(+)